MCGNERQRQRIQERSSMRVFVTASALIAVGLGVWGCNGSSYSNGNSGNPNTPTPSIPGVVTINVVAINGAQSFSPNPANLQPALSSDPNASWTRERHPRSPTR
jgi:hypothetical protein